MRVTIRGGCTSLCVIAAAAEGSSSSGSSKPCSNIVSPWRLRLMQGGARERLFWRMAIGSGAGAGTHRARGKVHGSINAVYQALVLLILIILILVVQDVCREKKFIFRACFTTVLFPASAITRMQQSQWQITFSMPTALPSSYRSGLSATY